MEGSLGPAAQGGNCILTCNWHNWKFDLASGETLVGGDKLRRYPVEIVAGEVWIDIADPPAEAVAAAALDALRDSFGQIGRAHVSTPVTNAHLVCRLLLEKKKQNNKYNHEDQLHQRPTEVAAIRQ